MEQRFTDTDQAIYTAFEDTQPKDPALAEKNLMRAILRSAIEDIEKRGELHRQARQFFISGEDQYLFSFLSICYHLGLCPITIRQKVGILSPADTQQLAA